MGYKIGMIIHVIMIIPFSMIWTTVRMQYAKDKDNSVFITKIISYYTIIGLLLVLMTSLYAKELLMIFSGREEFIVAYKIVPIIMISHLIYGYINIVDFGILISKKLHFFYITFLVAAVLNAILNYFFIPKFGYIAAAYITLLTYIFCSAVIYLLGRKYYLIDIEYLRVFMPFIIVILILLLFAEMKLSLLYVIILKFLVVFVSIFLTYKFWLTKHEKDIINKNLLKP
jgi:O-antigen/teichoic acid export membrane protein